MTDLISLRNIPINTEIQQTVDARELHEFLEVRTEFRHWIRRRIEHYGFIQDIDFITRSEMTAPGATPQIDYFLTIAMAKELSMIERTEKGQQARRYFIECERQLKAQQSLPVAVSALPSTQVLLHAVQHLIAQEAQIAEQERRLTLLEANARPHADYVSLKGYANLCKKRCTNAELAQYGRDVTKYAQSLGLVLGDIPDEKWGRVNTYPPDLLDEFFHWREAP